MDSQIDPSKVPPPFPHAYHSIITETNDTTKTVIYSGRIWYDWDNHKQRLDIKKKVGEMWTFIWRFDEDKKYTVKQTNKGKNCNSEPIDNKDKDEMMPPLEYSSSRYIGNETIWGEQCDHFKITLKKQGLGIPVQTQSVVALAGEGSPFVVPFENLMREEGQVELDYWVTLKDGNPYQLSRGTYRTNWVFFEFGPQNAATFDPPTECST